MSIETTFQALAAKLETVDPTPQPQPVRVFSNPVEAVSLAEFPCIVLGLAPNPGTQNTWSQEAQGGWGRNDYTVAIWIFVGSRQTGLNELYGRILPWPKAVADVLVADITLSGQVAFIGDAQNSNRLFTWLPKYIQWADGQYFGLEILLPVTERHIQQMG